MAHSRKGKTSMVRKNNSVSLNIVDYIPVEIWLYILFVGQFNPAELCQLSTVSKIIAEASVGDALWKQFFNNTIKIDQPAQGQLTKKEMFKQFPEMTKEEFRRFSRAYHSKILIDESKYITEAVVNNSPYSVPVSSNGANYLERLIKPKQRKFLLFKVGKPKCDPVKFALGEKLIPKVKAACDALVDCKQSDSATFHFPALSDMHYTYICKALINDMIGKYKDKAAIIKHPACLDKIADYVKTQKMFDRVVVLFDVLKHPSLVTHPDLPVLIDEIIRQVNRPANIAAHNADIAITIVESVLQWNDQRNKASQAARPRM